MNSKISGRKLSTIMEILVNKFIGFETPRLQLRDFTQQDLKTFAEYRNEPKVARYQSWQDYDSARAEAFFETQQELNFGELGSWYQIAIADKQTGDLIGDCVIHFTDAHQVEIGATMSPEYQGKGLAKEAVSALVAFIFNELKMHRITAVTDTLNHDSVKLLEALGFRQEAHLVENIYFKGRWGSEYIYAMLKREFDLR